MRTTSTIIDGSSFLVQMWRKTRVNELASCLPLVNRIRCIPLTNGAESARVEAGLFLLVM